MRRRARPGLAACAAASAVALALGLAPGAAVAHDDPPGHSLETDLLYPAVGDRPSPETELALLGLLQVSAADGYPIRVALVANETDVEDPEMVARPQAYAAEIVLAIESERGTLVAAPVLVVSPSGYGVAGRARRDGGSIVIGPSEAATLVAGLPPPAGSDGTALATAAMAAVRQIARLGGHPLPDRVAPARATFTAADRPAEGFDWVPLTLFVMLFVPSWLAYELVSRRRAARGTAPRPGDQPPATTRSV